MREQTGFAIGGVPPYGHARAIETIVDEDLLAYADGVGRGGDAVVGLPDRAGRAGGAHRRARVERVSPGS